jgi:hypothetical protein
MSESLLPTRVIDVGPKDGSSVPFIRITTDRSRGSYVALSHCWGGRIPEMTTGINISEREQALPIEKLPQTFADAIKITRCLDFRHLWIDNLCIYFGRSRTKYRRNLRFGPLFSEGLRFALEEFFNQIPRDPYQEHQKTSKQTQAIPASNKIDETLYIDAYLQALTQVVRH